MTNALQTPLRDLHTEDGRVFVKDETAQIGGSFKFRGPDRFFAKHPEIRAVVTASSGNHAIGVSNAAKMNGAQATIYLPENTPEAKLSKIRQAGGICRMVPGSYEDALSAAIAHAEAGPDTLLPSYDHPEIIAGNGGLYDEAEAQAGTRFDRIAVPVGGGGCVSAAIHYAARNGTRVLAAEYAPFERIRQIALERQGDDIQTDHPAAPSTEGIAIRTLGKLNRQIIASCPTLDLAQVTYEEMRAACRWLYDSFGIVAELGASAGVAAALKHRAQGASTLCVVTGGNIDPALHAELMAGPSSPPDLGKD